MQTVRILLVVALCVAAGLFVYRHRTSGWDQNIDPRYSPEYPERRSLASRVAVISLHEYGFFGRDHTIVFRQDGTAEFIGREAPVWLRQMNSQTDPIRLGRYAGHTNEFSHLASWLLSQSFLTLKDPCPQKRGYDVPIVTVTLVADGRTKEITTCGLSGRNFDPIVLTQSAIEEVASRVHWQQEGK